MQDKSDLYMPPKGWEQGAEAWYEQVEFIIKYTREQVAQEIEARSTGEDKVVWMNDALKNCAAIARGKK